MSKKLFKSQKNDIITGRFSNGILLNMDKFLRAVILLRSFVTDDSFLIAYKRKSETWPTGLIIVILLIAR